ncbi:MAG: hypothetical protein BWY91_01341 [bacterium ADurb.BinA028]|nr:MAG: hypothetical protein BWY91_01341 [bacterium ADurb.BinA028]
MIHFWPSATGAVPNGLSLWKTATSALPPESLAIQLSATRIWSE